MHLISEVLVEMKLRMMPSLALDDDLCWCFRLAQLSGRSWLSWSCSAVDAVQHIGQQGDNWWTSSEYRLKEPWSTLLKDCGWFKNLLISRLLVTTQSVYWHIRQAAVSANGDLHTGAADETTAILNAINSRLFEDAQNLKCNMLFESEDFL